MLIEKYLSNRYLCKQNNNFDEIENLKTINTKESNNDFSEIDELDTAAAEKFNEQAETQKKPISKTESALRAVADPFGLTPVTTAAVEAITTPVSDLLGSFISPVSESDYGKEFLSSIPENRRAEAQEKMNQRERNMALGIKENIGKHGKPSNPELDKAYLLKKMLETFQNERQSYAERSNRAIAENPMTSLASGIGSGVLTGTIATKIPQLAKVAQVGTQVLPKTGWIKGLLQSAGLGAGYSGVNALTHTEKEYNLENLPEITDEMLQAEKLGAVISPAIHSAIGVTTSLPKIVKSGYLKTIGKERQEMLGPAKKMGEAGIEPGENLTQKTSEASENLANIGYNDLKTKYNKVLNILKSSDQKLELPELNSLYDDISKLPDSKDKTKMIYELEKLLGKKEVSKRELELEKLNKVRENMLFLNEMNNPEKVAERKLEQDIAKKQAGQAPLDMKIPEAFVHPKTGKKVIYSEEAIPVKFNEKEINAGIDLTEPKIFKQNVVGKNPGEVEYYTDPNTQKQIAFIRDLDSGEILSYKVLPPEDVKVLPEVKESYTPKEAYDVRNIIKEFLPKYGSKDQLSLEQELAKNAQKSMRERIDVAAPGVKEQDKLYSDTRNALTTITGYDLGPKFLDINNMKEWFDKIIPSLINSSDPDNKAMVNFILKGGINPTTGEKIRGLEELSPTFAKEFQRHTEEVSTAAKIGKSMGKTLNTTSIKPIGAGLAMFGGYGGLPVRAAYHTGEAVGAAKNLGRNISRSYNETMTDLKDLPYQGDKLVRIADWAIRKGGKLGMHMAESIKEIMTSPEETRNMKLFSLLQQAPFRKMFMDYDEEEKNGQ